MSSSPSNENEKLSFGALLKKRLLFIIIMSLSFSFTILFFTPIDVVINNQTDFVVNLADIVKPTLLATAAVFAALVLVSVILLFISEKLYKGFTMLVLGALLASYVHMLFFGNQLNEISGGALENVDRSTVVFDAAIYLVMLLLPLVLCIYFSISANKAPAEGSKEGGESSDEQKAESAAAEKESSENKDDDDEEDEGKNKKAGLAYWKDVISEMPIFLFAAIFLMQVTGLVSSLLRVSEYQVERNYDIAQSYRPIMSMSKDKNVVVFIVDRLDSMWTDDLIEVYPELNEKLDGFTFYQNYMSQYTNTFPSVPCMLTDYEFDGSEWNDYLKNAWAHSDNALTRMKENGYTVNLILDGATTFTNLEQFSAYADNLNKVGFVEFNNKQIVRSMLDLSLLKIRPFFIDGSRFAEKFLEMTSNYVNSDLDEFAPYNVSPSSDMQFYHYMKDTPLKADNSKKNFSFIHLNGAHDSNEDVMTLAPHDASATTRDPDVQMTARGELEIIIQFMDKLKEEGVYDNTAIILVADHGMKPFELDFQDELENPNVAALLIKPAGAERGPLKFNRDSQLTSDFFQASLLEYAGIDHSDFGPTFNEIVDNGVENDRYFETFRFHSFGNEELLHRYKVVGDARDFDNWTEVE